VRRIIDYDLSVSYGLSLTTAIVDRESWVVYNRSSEFYTTGNWSISINYSSHIRLWLVNFTWH